MGRTPLPTLSAMICVMLATPTLAALGDEITPTDYRGLCIMPQTCSDTTGCTATPVLGELLLTTEDGQTALGRSNEDLSPIDHYPTLDDAFPLPQMEAHRRSFLVDLPPDGRIRRFALHIQIIDAQTREDALRPRYYVLECLEAPP